MTEIDNEAVEAVARALEPKCRAFGVSTVTGRDQGGLPMQVAREFARAAIAAMPGWREPVTWRWKYKDAMDMKWMFSRTHPGEAGIYVEPLYALPAPPKPEGA